MENPRDVIANLGKLGLEHYGDEATHIFFEHLKAREFKSTRCKKCAALHYPPRHFCPACGHRETEWVDLPKRAKLYAFSQQDRALRFMKPDVLGLVEIEGLGHILTKIDAPIESLSIGQDLELDFIEIDGGLVLHQFKPTLAAYKMPKKVVFVPELPRNPMGKVLKKELRQRHQGLVKSMGGPS